MADILRITTPLVNKNQVQPGKQVLDPSVLPFNLQDISRVAKPNSQSEILKQNNGLIQQEQAPSILMNLLKDPSVTVGFLKNIFMLQEIIKLLPVNNQTMTEELDQLFDSLLISPEDVVLEMLRQEQTSTAFKGELFNFLRQLLSGSANPELKAGVANLLKALNSHMGRRDVLDAVGNSLQFLAEQLESSRSLSARLSNLSSEFYKADAAQRFGELKTQALELFGEVEDSILFSPKLAKVLSISIYNLSRFNDNPDFLKEAVSYLLTQVDGTQDKAKLLTLVRGFLEGHDTSSDEKQSSQVMDVLSKILSKQMDDPSLTLLNSDKIEKIIHSLLSSPCNFTPLLHFVVPVEYMNIKSFAEIWINPNGEEDRRDQEGAPETIHMLLVFDVEGLGQFEAELFVSGQTIDLSLLCPTGYLDAFREFPNRLSKQVAGSGYQFGSVNVNKLERPRSLMEVFKSLPYKRTGVDVTV